MRYKFIYILFLLFSIGCREDLTNPEFKDTDLQIYPIAGENRLPESFSVYIGDTIAIELQVSPAESTVTRWSIDDDIIEENTNSILYKTTSAGEFLLKFEAARPNFEDPSVTRMLEIPLTVLEPLPDTPEDNFVPKDEEYKLVGFVNRVSSNFTLDDYTHIIYNSAQITNDGIDFKEVPAMIEEYNQKALDLGIYTMLSINGELFFDEGGWANQIMADIITDSEQSDVIIAEIVKYVYEHQLKGIDFHFTDYAGTTVDYDKVEQFIRKLREALPPPNLLSLTQHVPWHYEKMNNLVQIESLDFINLKTYNPAIIDPVNANGYPIFTSESAIAIGDKFLNGELSTLDPSKVNLGVTSTCIRYSYFEENTDQAAWQVANYFYYSELETVSEGFDLDYESGFVDNGIASEEGRGIYFPTLNDVEQFTNEVKSKGFNGVFIYNVSEDNINKPLGTTIKNKLN